MGTSTDAILVYGVPLPDYDECAYEDLPWAVKTDDYEDEDFDDTIARRAGAPKWGEEGYSYERKQAAVDACPITLVQHCHYEYPNWILGIKATEMTARRGYPVTFESLDPIPLEAFAALKAFCEEFGIEFSPKWVLCSDWH